MKGILASLIGIILGAVTFAIICYVFDAPSTNHLIVATTVGAFTGLLAAPEFSPNSFRNPRLVQVLSGAGAGIGTGVFFHAAIIYIIIFGLIGAIIGYYEKVFVEEVHVP